MILLGQSGAPRTDTHRKNNALSIGSLVALLTLIDKAYSPIAIFNVLFAQFKLDRSAFNRYTNILDMPDDTHLNSGRLVKNIDGNSALWNACFGDSYACFEALVSAGINIDSQNVNNVTSLMDSPTAGTLISIIHFYF